MWTIAVVCLLAGAAQAGYSNSGSKSGSFAGSSAGAGSNSYGSYSGQNSYGPSFPYGEQNYQAGQGFGQQFPAPFPPFLNPQEFRQSLNNYFQALQNNHAAATSMTFASPEATAYASSSLYPENLYQQQLQHQQAFFNSLQQQQQQAQASFGQGGSRGGFGQQNGGGFGQQNGGGFQHQTAGSFGRHDSGYGGYAPNYASSSASYGPGGIHQTAHINPQNPNSPNIDARFGDDSVSTDSRSAGPGFFGVASSSFSSSANVNGKETSQRAATTTVNDNGKITTYETHS